jgi:hypothetical protein
MDNNTFWTVVDESRLRAERDESRFREELFLRLLQLPALEIQAFNRVRVQLDRALVSLRVDGKELHEAVFDAWGGCSDDSFLDFRSSVLANGRAFYESMVRDPGKTLREPASQRDFSLRFEAALFDPLYRIERDVGLCIFEDEPVQDDVVGDVPDVPMLAGTFHPDRRVRAAAYLRMLDVRDDDEVRVAFRRTLTRCGPRWGDATACHWLLRDVRERVARETEGWPDLTWEPVATEAPLVARLIEGALDGDDEIVSRAIRELASRPMAEWAGSASRVVARAVTGARRQATKKAASCLKGQTSWVLVPLLCPWLEDADRGGLAFFRTLAPCRPLELHLLRAVQSATRDDGKLSALARVGGDDARQFFLARAAARQDLDALEALVTLGDPVGACVPLAAMVENPDDRLLMSEALMRLRDGLSEAAAIVGGESRFFEERIASMDDEQRTAVRAEAVTWLSTLAKQDVVRARDALRKGYERTEQGPLRTSHAIQLGILGDATGVDELLQPPEGDEDRALWLRAIATLGPEAARVDLDTVSAEGPVESAWLAVARVTTEPTRTDRVEQLVHRLDDLVALAIDASDQYVEGLIMEWEGEAKVSPAVMAMSVLGELGERGAVNRASRRIREAIEENPGRENLLGELRNGIASG